MTYRTSLVAALVLLFAPPLAAAQSAARPPSLPTADMPELARLGIWPVGERQDSVSVGLVRALGDDGRVATVDRRVTVRIWYPAQAVSGDRASYDHVVHTLDRRTATVSFAAIATADAPFARGRFPLVVVSHGLGGWSATMSYLTENLASKGYVVVAIDHGDPEIHSVPEFRAAMANVAHDRALDQRAVIRRMLELAAARQGVGLLLDPDHIGLVGYSMGGFGALAAAGANFDPHAPVLTRLPGELAADMVKPDDAVAPAIGALVAIAPWGAQPSQRAWTAEDLARIRAPTLLIDGSADDVVDFEQGVRWVFDRLTSARRSLLVFRGAGHGVGVNALPPAAADDASQLDYFGDPVWRTDRLNGISVHFITAFLDAHLKGEAEKARYLDVPTPSAEDGVWPQTFGELGGPRYAGDGQPGYWRGFQRGSAIGLELHALAPGKRKAGG